MININHQSILLFPIKSQIRLICMLPVLSFYQWYLKDLFMLNKIFKSIITKSTIVWYWKCWKISLIKILNWELRLKMQYNWNYFKSEYALFYLNFEYFLYLVLNIYLYKYLFSISNYQLVPTYLLYFLYKLLYYLHYINSLFIYI